MFLMRRPSADVIERFLRDSSALPLSYGPIGLLSAERPGWDVDEATAVVGHGLEDLARARAALASWQQFKIGWVDTFPHDAGFAVGTVVAVLIRHFGFWSLNGARVLYHAGGREDLTRFGFAYGTLTNHAESGEELFEVFIEPRTDAVIYRIRATSHPQALLVRIGKPLARVLQARFRRDSAEAMRRAIGSDGRPG